MHSELHTASRGLCTQQRPDGWLPVSHRTVGLTARLTPALAGPHPDPCSSLVQEEEEEEVIGVTSAGSQTSQTAVTTAVWLVWLPADVAVLADVSTTVTLSFSAGHSWFGIKRRSCQEARAPASL
ncbi:unnamed protein product [Arctogadus glacialis]